MASNKKVIQLGLDYSNFSGGVTEVNRKMSLLDEQFKLCKEEIKAYGDETDQLALKNEQLTEKINLQTRKVELAKEAYNKATASGDASEKQLDNLQKEYIKNQTQLQKLNNELTENKAKLDNAHSSSKTFGDSIRGVASSLGIEVSPAVELLATKFDGLDSRIGSTVLTIGILVTALAGCTVSAGKTADELLELSSVTGVSTDELQKMQYAASDLDVETETITGSMTKLIRNMNTARKGANDQSEAFKQLHVSFKNSNGTLKDSEEVFYRTIDALGKVKNETDRDALAMTLFGKSARELNPLIETGSKKLREIGEEAKDMGAVMGRDSLEDLGAFNDTMEKVNEKMEIVKVQLGLALLPVLQKFADILEKIPVPALIGIMVFGILAGVILNLSRVFSTAAIAQAALSTSNVTVGQTGMMASIGMTPLLLILLAIAAVVAIVIGKMASLKSAVKDATDVGTEAVNQATKAAQTMQQTQQGARRSVGYANGTKYAAGGVAWVGEAGPELVRLPGGSQVYTNAESKGMVGGNTYINVTVPIENLKQIFDVVEWSNGLKQKYRQGGVRIG